MHLDHILNGTIDSMSCQEHKQAIKCLRSIIEKMVPEISNLRALISEISIYFSNDYYTINKASQLKQLNELLSLSKSERTETTLSSVAYNNKKATSGLVSLAERMNALDIQNEIIAEKTLNASNGSKEITETYFKAIYQDPRLTAPMMFNPNLSIKSPILKKSSTNKEVDDMDIVHSDNDKMISFSLRKSASVPTKINKVQALDTSKKATGLGFKKIKREKKKKKEKIVPPIPIEKSSSENDLPADIRPPELQNVLKKKSVFFDKQKEQFNAINQIKIPIKRNFLNFDKSALLFNEFVLKIKLEFDVLSEATISTESLICNISHQASANHEWKFNKLQLIPAGDAFIPPSIKINKFVPNNWLNPILSRLLDFNQSTSSTIFQPTNDVSNSLLVNNPIILNSTKNSCFLFIIEENVHVTLNKSTFVNFNQIIDKILGLSFIQKDTVILDHNLNFLPRIVKSVSFDCNLQNTPISQYLMNLNGLETIYYKGNSSVCDIKVVDYTAFDYLMEYSNIGQIMLNTIILVIYNEIDYKVLSFNKEQVIYYIDDQCNCEDVECIIEMLEQIENIIICGNTWFEYIESCDVACIPEAISIGSLVRSDYCRDSQNMGYKQIRYIYKIAPTKVPLVMNYSLDDLFVNSGIYNL